MKYFIDVPEEILKSLRLGLDKDNTFWTPGHQSEEYIVKFFHLLCILCLICFKFQTLQNAKRINHMSKTGKC